jgi:hypothetical protein
MVISVTGQIDKEIERVRKERKEFIAVRTAAVEAGAGGSDEVADEWYYGVIEGLQRAKVIFEAHSYGAQVNARPIPADTCYGVHRWRSASGFHLLDCQECSVCGLLRNK